LCDTCNTYSLNVQATVFLSLSVLLFFSLFYLFYLNFFLKKGFGKQLPIAVGLIVFDGMILLVFDFSIIFRKA